MHGSINIRLPGEFACSCRNAKAGLVYKWKCKSREGTWSVWTALFPDNMHLVPFFTVVLIWSHKLYMRLLCEHKHKTDVETCNAQNTRSPIFRHYAFCPLIFPKDVRWPHNKIVLTDSRNDPCFAWILLQEGPCSFWLLHCTKFVVIFNYNSYDFCLAWNSNAMSSFCYN